MRSQELAQADKIRTALIGFLLGVSGAVILWMNTPWGIGVGYDSVFYLSAADNFLNGLGLSRLDGFGNVIPLTHYPPIYPLTLAVLVVLSGHELVFVARVLSAILFGVNVFLTAWVITRYTQTPWVGLLGGVLALSSPILIDVHLMAMSEALYLPILLSGLFILDRYLMDEPLWLLFVSGGVGALAYLIRYVGISFLVTGVFSIILFGQRTPRRKVGDIIMFGFLATFPTLAWYFRNWRLTGGFTNRVIAFHPPALGDIRQGLVTLSLWLLPRGVPAILRLILLIALIFGLGTVVVNWCRRWRDGQFEFPLSQSGLQFTAILAIYICVYTLVLAVSLTFFDASTRLNDRILSPVYMLGIVLVVVTLWKPLSDSRSQWKIVGFILLSLGLIIVNSLRSDEVLWKMRQNGRGFTGRQWQHSETIREVEKLPPDTIIYSNEAFPIYFLTGRPSNWIPEKIDVVKQQSVQNYDQQLENMRQTIIRFDGFLVIFDSIERTNAYAPIEELVDGLVLQKKLDDGAVYGSP